MTHLNVCCRRRNSPPCCRLSQRHCVAGVRKVLGHHFLRSVGMFAIAFLRPGRGWRRTSTLRRLTSGQIESRTGVLAVSSWRLPRRPRGRSFQTSEPSVESTAIFVAGYSRVSHDLNSRLSTHRHCLSSGISSAAAPLIPAVTCPRHSLRMSEQYEWADHGIERVQLGRVSCGLISTLRFSHSQKGIG